MKRVMAIGRIVNAVLLAGVLLKEEVVVHAAGGGGGVPLGNGDVNGDGKIDIGDAVYTLSWLFTGGPGPVAIECPAPAGKGLPATGQTRCYRFDEIAQVWASVPCGEVSCDGQDGAYAKGCPSEGRFVDNGDGTVSDTCTGLMWQREGTNDESLTWCQALAYCEDLTLGEHGDWRLPNLRELQSIVDYGREPPAIDPIFNALGAFAYWSSTTYHRAGGLRSRPNDAWLVHFFDGLVDSDLKDNLRCVRAVRNAP